MDLFAFALDGDFFLSFAQKFFQPLLLFFYLGFLILIFKVPYEFPKQVYCTACSACSCWRWG